VPRRATGTIVRHRWKDGRTISWWLRVRAYGRRWRVDLGTSHEGWNEERAQVELDRILAQIDRGTWQPPEDEPTPASFDTGESETFHVFASRWWHEKKATLSERGREDVEWRLGHLLAHFRDLPVADFTVRAVDEYRAAKVAERQHPERLPGKRRPLGNRSINMTLVLLAQILDVAVEYGLLDANPAQGRRRRLTQQKPTRNFLEPDMVVDMLEAADEWEREVPPHQRYGRRPLLALLCLGGPRISEALSYDRGQLDLHAGVLRGGLKTAAARNRTVDLTAFLLEELREHVAGLPAQRGLLFPSRTGGSLSAHNVRSRLLRGGPGRTLKDGTRSRTRGVVERANEKRAAEGRLLIPDGVTPHTLRRTFASLCFFAGRDARFVMAQLGHTDARLTLQVYAQCMERRRIDDELVWLLMRFPDEAGSPPSRRSFGPLNDPVAPKRFLDGPTGFPT
jgi:integrase